MLFVPQDGHRFGFRQPESGTSAEWTSLPLGDLLGPFQISLEFSSLAEFRG
jgi:hypothetical protein